MVVPVKINKWLKPPRKITDLLGTKNKIYTNQRDKRELVGEYCLMEPVKDEDRSKAWKDPELGSSQLDELLHL